ncbi:MAG: 7TM diverse intracellular signaling domain-containing protein, partial [Candidatus Competibacteraceae bacterium]
MLTLDAVEKAVHSGSVPPVEFVDGPLQTLPHDWAQDSPPANNLWYRAILDLNVPPNRLWGAYLPTVNMNAAVYLNGELLGDGGDFADPVARNWNRPLYFSIPNGLLLPGENEIHVRIKADPTQDGLMGRIFLGPDQDATAVFQATLFWKVTLVSLITLAMMLMSLFTGLLWWLRRRDTTFLWFALAGFTWSAHNLNLLVVNIPVSTLTWEWFRHVTLGWYVIFTIIFVHRFLNEFRPRVERMLVIGGVLATVLLALLPESWFYPVANRIWLSALLAAGAYPVMLIVMQRWGLSDLETKLLVMPGALILFFGFHDWLVVNGLWPRTEGYYIHYASPVVIVAFTYILLRRFVSALNESEALNAELEGRVAAARETLEANYQKLRTLEKQQVLVTERERLMRDMHDGMGGHLVSALALVQSGQTDRTLIAEALQRALDDLRLMIDSLEPIDDDLPTVLGMLRSRLQPQLQCGQLQINWQVQDVPSIPEFGPQKVLQVMRILQEAIANVIKHARATTLTVSTRVAIDPCGHDYVVVEIADDGVG